MSAWRNWLRSPVLLKYFVGQHIVNGVSVAAAVMLVSVAASSILGFGLGQPATLGAIGASISDFPGPWRVKARTLLVGFSLSLVSTIAVEFGQVNPLLEILVIGAVAFAAGLVTGLGRWALALNAQMLVPMIFIMGLPPLDAAGLAKAEALYALGGCGYIAIALALTGFAAESDRRMMASECFRELAAYLRAIAVFTDPQADIAEVYGAGLRQQAALSEQLQAARALLLTKPRQTPQRLRLAATIGILLDCFDALIASLSDLPDLRAAPNAGRLLSRIGIVLRAGALDLQGLSLQLLSRADPKLPRDHALAFDAALREAERVATAPESDAAEREAVRATMRRLAVARAHFLRLERALGDDAVAAQAISEVDLSAFAPRRSFSPSLLRPHLRPASPVFRYAVRLSLAMMAGGLTATSLGYEAHGNWVLLTIAVVLRPGYGLTRQRRDDRLIGTLLGCLIASGAVAGLPTGALIALQAGALALTHSFVRLDYKLASIGASLMALISLHLISPDGHAAALARIGDTLIGAAFAHLFSFVWPSWEIAEAPGLARRLLARASRFASVALKPGVADQDYRLARKDLIEAVAALSDSAARMGGEPMRTQRGLEEMTAMLIAASVFAAHVSAARLDAQGGEGEALRLSPRDAEGTRAWIAQRLAGGGGGEIAPDAPRPRLRAATLSLLERAAAYEAATGAGRASR